MHSEPNVDERALHEINNFAYAAWCEACLMAKGTTEPHRTNPKHLTRREYSTMNFNFSFTGHDCPQMPSLGDAVKPEETLIALNLFGSQSGCVFSTPVRNRSDVHCRKMITISHPEGSSQIHALLTPAVTHGLTRQGTKSNSKPRLCWRIWN